MKVSVILVLASSALFSLPTNAQFVKGNEAVRSTPTGKSIETPPVPASVGKVCAANGKCYAGSWHMVETEAGLVECTEAFARSGSCRASTYGAEKLRRLWVVKKGQTWLQCQYPDSGSKCVELFARPPANLPYDALQ
jgi:hypothetical protein